MQCLNVIEILEKGAVFDNIAFLQVSRKFEQNEVESLLRNAGADDSAMDSDFSQTIDIPESSRAQHPTPLPTRPQSAQVSRDRASQKPSRFNLQQAINAKPFVPRAMATQQVNLVFLTHLWDAASRVSSLA